jgi:signal transduction histidine kinase/CheY-like chemotaxis protein
MVEAETMEGKLTEQVMPFLESEVRITTRPVSAILLVLGVICSLVGDSLTDPTPRSKVLLVGVLFYGLTVLTWFLDNWQVKIGCWLASILLEFTINLGYVWLGWPGFLALGGVPIVIASELLGELGVVMLAACQTVFLVLLRRWTDPPLAWPSVVMAATSAWSIAALIWLRLRSVRDLTTWLASHYQRARSILDEATNQRLELKQALEDLAKANEQLTRLNALAHGLRLAADEARLTKERFVANVSHELRTPLNMVVGFSEVILEVPETYADDIPSALLADLAVIHRNARHLADLIDDVLDLSQIEAGQMALSKELVQLDEIIQAAAEAVRPLFKHKRLDLEIQVDADIPPLLCDRTRVREVILNLLSNAGRFTERGGAVVRAWREDSQVYVAVADTGSGIPKADLSRIFEPFQQQDGSIRRRYGGSGLGLTISKRFIELHGGRIWVESKPDSGTTFFFNLPLTCQQSISSDFSRWLDPTWEYKERERPNLAPKVELLPRFVLLDPSLGLQRLLTRYLDEAEVVPVDSLQAALHELDKTPAQALLVNELSVSEALERLETVSLPHEVPVIACAVPGITSAANVLGVSDYLVKPISREALLAALDKLDIKGNTLLLVDDEPEALRLFRRMLIDSERNYRVLRASDGRVALHILRQERPDGVLLDLIMPNMTGYEFLKAKHQDPALRDIPVIVVSARDPAGQPIVSSGVGAMCHNGLSAQRLLSCIRALSGILATDASIAGPVLPGSPLG